MLVQNTDMLYECDPSKNSECPKTHCYINDGDCHLTSRKEYKMENELRFYLGEIKKAIETETFKPTYIITAVKLPTGAIELAVNSTNIVEKIDYILETYNEDMQLKTNTEVVMHNLMVV